MEAALAAALLLLLAPQEWTEKRFEEEGISVSSPKGWTTLTPKDARVLVYAVLKEEGLTPQPRLYVIHGRSAIPFTPSSLKGQIRADAEKGAIEFKLVEEFDLTAEGTKGFGLVYETMTEKEPEKAVKMEVSRLCSLPGTRRFVQVEVSYPAAAADRLRPLARQVMDRVRCFPRKEPSDFAKGLKASADLVDRLANFTTAFESGGELDWQVSSKTVGTFRYSIQEAVEGEIQGYRIERTLAISQTDEGSMENTVRGFLSGDLKLQILEVRQKRTSKEGSEEVFASARLEKGKISVKRGILGEVSETAYPVPDRTVFLDLVDILVLRVVEYDQCNLFVRAISPFDEETTPLKIECAGRQKVRTEDGRVEGMVVFVEKGDSAVVTFHVDDQRRLVWMKDGPITMKLKKKG